MIIQLICLPHLVEQGKLHILKKWLENLNDAFVVNGDKPLVKITETETLACGTPWCGKESLGRNVMVPLKAIVIMERGDNNHIREIPFMEAFAFLLRQTYHPRDTEKMKKTLSLFSQLKGKVRVFHFIFNNMKEDTFNVAYKALKEGTE